MEFTTEQQNFFNQHRITIDSMVVNYVYNNKQCVSLMSPVTFKDIDVYDNIVVCVIISKFKYVYLNSDYSINRFVAQPHNKPMSQPNPTITPTITDPTVTNIPPEGCAKRVLVFISDL